MKPEDDMSNLVDLTSVQTIKYLMDADKEVSPVLLESLWDDRLSVDQCTHDFVEVPHYFSGPTSGPGYHCFSSTLNTHRCVLCGIRVQHILTIDGN